MKRLLSLLFVTLAVLIPTEVLAADSAGDTPTGDLSRLYTPGVPVEFTAEWQWKSAILSTGYEEERDSTGTVISVSDANTTYFNASQYDYLIMKYSASTCDVRIILQYHFLGTIGQWGADFDEATTTAVENPSGGVAAIKLDASKKERIHQVALQNFTTTGSITIESMYWATENEYNQLVGSVEWIEQLDNGDAEKPWANPDTRWNDKDNNYKICAWGKTKGRNMTEDGEGWNAFPADIEEEEGNPSNHVFVVHAANADTPSNDAGDDVSSWDNQFWIQSPHVWRAGTEIRIKFRYKASKDVAVVTQVHKQNPSDYLHWYAIGDIAFTTDWQEFDGIMKIDESMDGTWSIAFNLNSSEKTATDFYFDDLSWSVMQQDTVPVVIDESIIRFADANVKAICVNKWDKDGDGELSKTEAAAVTSLDNAFTNNTDIRSFDEFQYFVGVTALGSEEFSGCYGLSSIVLPPYLKSLGVESLRNNNIDDLMIPASVTSIEPTALYSCYKNIFVEEGNAYFTSIDGVLFDKNITKIVTYPVRRTDESYAIPSTVVTIGGCAFYGSGLKSVTIPNGVTTIEHGAFRYVSMESIDIPNSVEVIEGENFEGSRLTGSVTIPASVKEIGSFVFAICPRLQEIIVEEDNQYYTSVDGVLYSKNKTLLVTYPAGKPDESVVIPNFVTAINTGALYGCKNIKSVVIPRKVESIGWFAFVSCDSLASVTTYRKNPLELRQTFSSRVKENGTLYVPYGTKAKYLAAEEWNGFKNIEELDPSADPTVVISLVNNGDMEGDDNSNYFIRLDYSNGNEEPTQAAISDGVGMNGTRGIKVEATPKVAAAWDNQLWVRLNQPISEGTTYRVAFDYRADKEALIGTEAHEEPTTYISWGFFDYNDMTFKDEWQHFEYEGTMSSQNSSDHLPFQSLTFTFNGDYEDANNYYFDNIEFEAIMDDQCPKPTFKQKGNEISILSPFNAKIYYTLDGSTPTTSSLVYAGPLKFTENAEINAIAVVEGYETSSVATCKYVHPQFDSNGVLMVSGRTRLPDVLEVVGGREEVAKTITAILWEGNYAVYNSELQGLDNPNMLIYVDDFEHAPMNRDNVIIDSVASTIRLQDTGSGNCNFYVPIPFTAKGIVYTREFKQSTQVGVSRGWESIALPFDVQTIYHENQGVIAPFGNSDSSKHFWLRQLGPDGLQPATHIEANTPYIISMPNDTKNYLADYLLAGNVWFSASNATVPVTELKRMTLADESIIMMPTMRSIGVSSEVYALNVGIVRSQYLEGSAFERDYRVVRPFEAYTVHRNQSPAPRFVPIKNMMDESTGIGSVNNDTFAVQQQWFTIDGRKLQGKPTQKGVYIQNGRKVIIP